MKRVAPFVMTVLLSSVVFAQVDTGTVQGTVRDATGGVCSDRIGRSATPTRLTS